MAEIQELACQEGASSGSRGGRCRAVRDGPLPRPSAVPPGTGRRGRGPPGTFTRPRSWAPPGPPGTSFSVPAAVASEPKGPVQPARWGRGSCSRKGLRDGTGGSEAGVTSACSMGMALELRASPCRGSGGPGSAGWHLAEGFCLRASLPATPFPWQPEPSRWSGAPALPHLTLSLGREYALVIGEQVGGPAHHSQARADVTRLWSPRAGGVPG